MAFSKLTNVKVLASSTNYTKGRSGEKITKITIHHMAGNLTAEQCGRVFQAKNRGASTNYGIDTKGRIGGYVDEVNRSWASANGSNDRKAITMEIANDGGASTKWHVSDKAIASCINLCVDICKRHGIKKINYNSKSTGNLTRHNMFVATSCPGPYLQSKFSYIANEVNKRLGAKPTPAPTKKRATIKKGSKGADVKYLQQRLTAKGYRLVADSIFGNATLNAVKKFQKNNKLIQDGIVGAKTWAKLG